MVLDIKIFPGSLKQSGSCKQLVGVGVRGLYNGVRGEATGNFKTSAPPETETAFLEVFQKELILI